MGGVVEAVTRTSFDRPKLPPTNEQIVEKEHCNDSKWKLTRFHAPRIVSFQPPFLVMIKQVWQWQEAP